MRSGLRHGRRDRRALIVALASVTLGALELGGHEARLLKLRPGIGMTSLGGLPVLSAQLLDRDRIAIGLLLAALLTVVRAPGKWGRGVRRAAVRVQ